MVTDNIIRIKTNIANAYNALSTKGATMPDKRNSDNLASCAESISTGDGSATVLTTLIDRSIKNIENDTEVVGQYAFSNCSNLYEVRLLKARDCEASAFQNCSSLETISMPELQTVGNNAFVSCTKLKTVGFPKVISVGNLVFRYCNALANIYLPSATSIGAQAFQNCINLVAARFDKPVTLNNLSFGQCSKFATLVLTSTDGISTLANATALNGTPIASGTGYIYTPSALIDEFKSATNWSAYASQFRAIEDYPEVLNIVYGGVAT